MPPLTPTDFAGLPRGLRARGAAVCAPLLRARTWLLLAGVLAGCILIAVVLRPLVGEGYASLVFVLGVVAIGGGGGLAAALLGAVLATLAFNWFVSAPRFSLDFDSLADFTPPVAFMLTAVFSGLLSGRLRDETLAARSALVRIERTFRASRELQAAVTAEDALAALRHALPRVELWLFRIDPAAPAGLTRIGDPRASEAVWALAQEVSLGGAERIARDGLVARRMDGSGGTVGAVVGVQRRPGDDIPPEVTPEDFAALVRMAAITLDRIDLAARLAGAEAEARSEAFKSTLLSSVSHDLRTPLTTISTAAATLLAFGGSFDAETGRDLLEGIVDEAARLGHVTTNLLELARLQSGEGRLRPTLLGVAETLAAIIARAQRAPNAAGRTIALRAPRAELVVAADAVLFDLAITNVIQNALRYSPPGAPVAVDVAAEGGVCTIVITDSGPGIPPEEQIRVFERFHRVHRPGAPGGSGLGLAIARGFVEASRGTIAIASPVAAGRGTALTIRLPLAPPA